MKALGDRVLVEPIEEEKGNWKSSNSKIKSGKITSVGSQVMDLENIVVGNTVTFLDGTGTDYGDQILFKERELLVKL